MGIIERLSRLIRSNINDLISRAENPDKVLNEIIEDMRRQLAQAKQEVAVAIADERKLRSDYEKEAKSQRDWEARARLALEKGREDLARQALMRGQEQAQHAAALKEQWEKHQDQTEVLKGSLRQLNSKIEEAKRKKNLLIAKSKRAEAQKRIHNTMQGLGDRSAFRAFEQISERVEAQEREAIASFEVSEALTGDTLKKEFESLEGGADVEAQLLSMKQSMGLLGAGESEEVEVKVLGRGVTGDENSTI